MRIKENRALQVILTLLNNMLSVNEWAVSENNFFPEKNQNIFEEFLCCFWLKKQPPKKQPLPPPELLNYIHILGKKDFVLTSWLGRSYIFYFAFCKLQREEVIIEVSTTSWIFYNFRFAFFNRKLKVKENSRSLKLYFLSELWFCSLFRWSNLLIYNFLIHCTNEG